MAQINIAGTLHNTEEIQGDALNSHVVAHTDEILDSTKEKKQSEVNADVDTALADRYTKEETYSKSQLDNLITTPNVQYVTVTATAQTTAVTDVLPATGEADTIYRVGSWDGTQYDAGKYSEYAWNGSSYQLLAVRSGSIGGVYDISANNLTEGQPTQYADLAAALGVDGANVPDDIRRGGMSVKFIKGSEPSSDNKYVQYRYMGTATTGTPNPFLDTANWQGVDEVPTAGSQNLVESGGVEHFVQRIYDGYDKIDMFVNSNNKWKTSFTSVFKAFVVPVSANDVIKVTLSSSGYCYRGVYTDYPVLNNDAVNLLQSDRFRGTEEEISVPQDGYFVLWLIYSSSEKRVTEFLLNGTDLTIDIYNTRQLIKEQESEIKTIQGDIVSISGDISEIRGDIDTINTSISTFDSDIDNLGDEIGTLNTKEELVTISQSDYTINGINGSVGETITIKSTTGYKYIVRSVNAGERYRVRTKAGNSNNYPYYVYFTDNDNKIIDRQIPKTTSISGVFVEDYVDVPTNSTKMWILQIEGGNSYHIVLYKIVKKDLQTQINNLDNSTQIACSANKMMADGVMFGLESDWWITDKYLEDTFSTQEAIAFNAMKGIITGNSRSGMYKIAIISDTHGCGAYSWSNILHSNTESCYRSIAVFNKIAGYCDAALHGGDIACHYGTSRLRDLQYMNEIIRKFTFDKPFFITKGNHDENYNSYMEADMLQLDWDNETYYVRNFSTFTPVTQSTWDGSPLYIAKNEYVSDKEFRDIAQNWLSPSGKVWGNGAYYYFDIDSIKVRFVVGNSFPVDNEHNESRTFEDEEYLWIAQTAFDLSQKATPSDWNVILLRHTQSTSITALSNLINAFRTGSTWTYGTTTVDFGTMNGGAVGFIAHIHGHEHMNCFSNGSGYLDIGENSSYVTLANLGDATKYGISVWSIDTEHKKIYEDTISGKTWVYNYDTQKLEIAVGETFNAAKSGLTSPTTSSSDISIASCSGAVVTAVSAGECNITVSDGTNSFTYPIKVVSSY